MWCDALDHPSKGLEVRRMEVCAGMCAAYLPRAARELTELAERPLQGAAPQLTPRRAEAIFKPGGPGRT